MLLWQKIIFKQTSEIPALFLPTESHDDGGEARSQILEMQAVNPVDSRSWFLENEVIADGKLMLVTPVDPVFLLLPILRSIKLPNDSPGPFRPADDILEEAALAVQEQYRTKKEGQVSSEDVLHFVRLKCTKDALKYICDVKDITEDITVYRYSQGRTLEYLRSKVARLSEPKTLEISRSITRGLAKDGLMEDGNEELLKVGQLKAACDLIAHYLSPEIRALLYASYDFTKLDAFLKNAAADAMALAGPSENIKSKVAAKPETTDKKRKAAKASHGVESLKKANLKIYVDKGVQTSSVYPPVGSCTSKGSPTFAYPDDVCQHAASNNYERSEIPSPLLFSHESDAYIYSDVSFSDHMRYISERPVVGNRRALKYGELGHGKPSQLAMISGRVASLPETSPPGRIGPQQSERLVSMPDDLEMLRFPHGSSTRHQELRDHLRSSLTSNITSRTRSSEDEHAFLGGGPQTPSPPSSPDSVMIIGNDSQVPRAFLRTKLSSDDNARQNQTTWKGSPPKPIPALHGPLSLPYARCPSGAEGTVIEGEDLTHMIWGLDSNGSQLTQAKDQPNAEPIRSHSCLPHQSFNDLSSDSRQDHLTQDLYNQEIIDLARPEFHASLHSRPSGMQTSRSFRSYLSPLADNYPLRNNVQSKKANIYEFVRRDSPIQLYPSSFGLMPEIRPWNAGLGIDFWRTSLEGGVPASSDTLMAFNNRESSLVLNEAPESIYATHIHRTTRHLPIHDIRPFEHLGQHSGMPTPPDTNSPLWSPRFHQSDIESTSPKFTCSQIPSIRSVTSQQPTLHLPTRDTIISQQIQRQLLSTMPEHRSSISDTLETVGEAQRIPPPYHSPDILGADRSSYDNQSNGSQSLSKTRPTQDKSNGNNTPSSPVSPELRRGFARQQPRSIPLARLIQRRLSSVVEEVDVESSTSDGYKCPTPSSPPLNSIQGTECTGLGVLRKDEKRSVQASVRKQATITGSMTAPPIDQGRRAYRPPGHPSRRPSSDRDSSSKPQKSPNSDQTSIPANQSTDYKENTSCYPEVPRETEEAIEKEEID
ncbi:hypothetical protein NP233_g5437 [Leucocoprinus birnbaumii]|uniref:Ribonuclease H2 subunit B wHTH domain-containing protein n=1 Tax=Leucocoprinus birnbaumii TaxID=56174 RepID=A0AAD5VV93_9AGAR|nr:hypothetical protein NP233_g5437 [Leucocoprinus birnbaumii]